MKKLFQPILARFGLKFQPTVPEVFSSDWLQAGADKQERQAFANSATHNKIVLYHMTNLERAKSIYLKREIYGKDKPYAAHFHTDADTAAEQADKNGALLGFIWVGRVQTASPYQLMIPPISPNILFQVHADNHNDRVWEFRLHPVTNGLMLSYIEMEQTGYRLKEPVALTVTTPR